MRWTWRWVCTVFLLHLLIAPAMAMKEINWEALFAGEVEVEAVRRPDGISGLRALFTITAPRDRIWTTLLDYSNFPKMFPEIKTIRVLENTQQGAHVEYWVDAVLSEYHYVVYRRYDEPGRRLSWSRISGDVKRIEGSWEIRETPRPDVQMLVYESYVDIGGILPVALVRAEAMRRTHEMGERLRSWIEGRAACLPATSHVQTVGIQPCER
ncbi:MAG: hypothetical protein FJZ47_10910 [Candidatus Tectomicrobia bacterium]|uniref:Coenzyme Q-binding protein COQ10 START domain-containing protein n=1 Tax=Tectimicrobiota bacterium TaxID=2528274 RepID=A0A937W037_UNCTE|nr:hypothetical protein [Candidatus Tectomicrobia bacterium]